MTSKDEIAKMTVPVSGLRKVLRGLKACTAFALVVADQPLAWFARRRI